MKKDFWRGIFENMKMYGDERRIYGGVGRNSPQINVTR